MSDADNIKQGIRQAIDERTDADRRWRAATDRLGHLLRRGRQANVPVAELMELSGLSRQGVYDLIDHDAELEQGPPRDPRRRRGRRAGA